MTLWLILTLIAALCAIAWAFAFSGGIAPSGSEVAVYKDQLAEIDRDREAGLIGTADAETARIEISRRLLEAADISESLHHPLVTGKNKRTRRLAVLAIALVGLSVLMGGLYLKLGSPFEASGEVNAGQSASLPDDASINALVAQVESYVKDKQNDGHGWEVLAPVYMHMGRYRDAVRAWQHAIANLGDSADREENLGEALVAAADGIVTDEARKAFDQALLIDRDSVDARFYIGLAAKQHGRPDEAAKIWRELIAEAPPDWTDTVREALAQLDEPSVTATGDAAISEQQQAAMIRTMVEGLSERLKTDGKDPEGWLRLVRSYNVLGKRDMAQTAVADARRALASDPDQLARFESGLNGIERQIEDQQVTRQPASPDAAQTEHDSATMQATVDKLAERLRSKGGDVDNWLMLVRSYETLGQLDKAMGAIAQARQAFVFDPEKLSHFDQLLRATDNASSATSTPENVEKPKINELAGTETAPAVEQTTMIKSMVDRLAERLKQDSHDVDGWIRLMRSYVALGQRDEAFAAGQKARVALGNDNEALRRLVTGAKELGVDLE
jgi:cytochrome c-type biogenesis protein CcmH